MLMYKSSNSDSLKTCTETFSCELMVCNVNRINETKKKNTEKETDHQGLACCRKGLFSVNFAEAVCIWSLQLMLSHVCSCYRKLFYSPNSLWRHFASLRKILEHFHQPNSSYIAMKEVFIVHKTHFMVFLYNVCQSKGLIKITRLEQ